MRCGQSEYQYNITRSYLRSPTNHQPALLPAANQERTQSSQTNQSVKKSSTANDDKFKSSHRNESDLDLMFEVKKSKKPGQFVATVDFDTNTGEVLLIQPLSSKTSCLPVYSSPSSTQRSDFRQGSLASKLVLNSFTRHGYNVEHIKGSVTGPLPGMTTRKTLR